MGTPEICLPKPFPSTDLIVWFMFWQYLVDSAQLDRIFLIYIYFPHMVIYQKNWAETLANQNMNSEILNA